MARNMDQEGCMLDLGFGVRNILENQLTTGI